MMILTTLPVYLLAAVFTTIFVISAIMVSPDPSLHPSWPLNTNGSPSSPLLGHSELVSTLLSKKSRMGDSSVLMNLTQLPSYRNATMVNCNDLPLSDSVSVHMHGTFV